MESHAFPLDPDTYEIEVDPEQIPSELLPLLEARLELPRRSSSDERVVHGRISHLLANRGRFEPGEYRELRALMLYAEELTLLEDLEACALPGVELERAWDEFHARVPLHRCPALLRGDVAYARMRGGRRTLRLVHLSDDSAVFQSQTAVFRGEEESVTADLSFKLNRKLLWMQHNALLEADDSLLRALHPQACDAAPQPSDAQLGQIRLFNEDIGANREQLLAVHTILQPASHPHPFILFGPPGTGKTATLVESIQQVWREGEPAVHILVTAPSNAACDLLAKKLLLHVPEQQLVRVYASSRREFPARLRRVARRPEQLGVTDFARAAVVVATLATCWRLHSPLRDPGHFTHVFIDEAGQASESEALLALARLAGEATRLVLAGDPRQLGAVVASRTAAALGLGVSLLERLAAHPAYAASHAHLVRLVRNYRSHPRLLQVPSRLFYEGALVACPGRQSLAALDGLLAAPGFPLVFHAVASPHTAHWEGKPTLCNEGELALVVEYMRRLGEAGVGPGRIGVMSPYRQQVRLIKGAVHQEVLVGSTEEFQGQERDIVVLSTVRSSLGPGEGLGFLVNEKRFNVAITRARMAMIVIGDPVLLAQDRHWSHLIQYIKDNGGFKEP